LDIDDFWLVVDDTGRLLEVSANPGSEGWRQGVIGRFFWNRDAFHGTGVDLDPPLPGQPRPANVVPIKRPHLSLVFRSDEERHPLTVLFSVPVASESGPPIGVLAMAVHLGNFSRLWKESDDAGAHGRWVTLVQTKEQKLPPNLEKGRLRNAGLILEHPTVRAAQEAAGGDVPLVYLDESVWSELKDKEMMTDYRDPFPAQTTGAKSNRYLAAAEPVRIRRRDSGGDKDGTVWEDTGWLAVAQDDYAMEVAPAVQLEWKLLWRTLLALAVAAALVTALWVVVSRGLIDAPRSRLAAFLRRRSGLTVRSTLATGSGSSSSTGATAPPASSVMRAGPRGQN
jgi:hypothetical protein